MTAVGVSQQTLRYWRKVLPPLTDRDSSAACFKFADLVALKLTHLLTKEAGIAVGTFSRMAQEVFEACAVYLPLASGIQAKLIIRPRNDKVILLRQDEVRATEGLEIAVPLGKCVAQLINALQDSNAASKQFSLCLPLAALSSGGR